MLLLMHYSAGILVLFSFFGDISLFTTPLEGYSGHGPVLESCSMEYHCRTGVYVNRYVTFQSVISVQKWTA